METVKSQSRLVFLGGVHGVGKSTICKEYLTPAGYACFTASTLIKDGGSLDIRTSKQVADVDRNQWVLLAGLRKTQGAHASVVLDGHYCLLNSTHQVEKVPMWLFQEMKPSALGIAIGAPQVIAQRLAARDAHLWTADFVDAFQVEELAYAREVAATLSAPLHEFSASDQAHDFRSFCGCIFKK